MLIGALTIVRNVATAQPPGLAAGSLISRDGPAGNLRRELSLRVRRHRPERVKVGPSRADASLTSTVAPAPARRLRPGRRRGRPAASRMSPGPAALSRTTPKCTPWGVDRSASAGTSCVGAIDPSRVDGDQARDRLRTPGIVRPSLSPHAQLGRSVQHRRPRNRHLADATMPGRVGDRQVRERTVPLKSCAHSCDRLRHRAGPSSTCAPEPMSVRRAVKRPGFRTPGGSSGRKRRQQSRERTVDDVDLGRVGRHAAVVSSSQTLPSPASQRTRIVNDDPQIRAYFHSQSPFGAAISGPRPGMRTFQHLIAAPLRELVDVRALTLTLRCPPHCDDVRRRRSGERPTDGGAVASAAPPPRSSRTSPESRSTVLPMVSAARKSCRTQSGSTRPRRSPR